MKQLSRYFALLIGVLAISTSAIFVKLAAAPSSITAFYRLFFALCFVAPTVLFQKNRRLELLQLSKKQIVMSLLSGILLAVHYILWFESLNYTSVASSTVLVALQPVFSMLIGFFLLKEKQTFLSMLGCLIALVGSMIIGWGDFQMGSRALLGDLMALLAAAFISCHFLVGQLIRKNTSTTVYSAIAYLGSVIFLAAYALLKQDSFFSYPRLTWLCFLGLALIPTIMGQFLFSLLLKWLPATMISMTILGEPVGTCILAYFILKESIGAQQGIGMAVILAGLGLYFLSAAVKVQKNLCSHKE